MCQVLLENFRACEAFLIPTKKQKISFFCVQHVPGMPISVFKTNPRRFFAAGVTLFKSY